MFKNSMEIITINKKNKFLKISGDDFNLDKGFITFYFATYNPKKEKNKIENYIKVWIPINEASMLAEYLVTSKIVTTCAKQIGTNFRTYKPYIHAGGYKTKEGPFSRQMYIEANSSGKGNHYITIVAQIGPATVSDAGLYILKKDENSKSKIYSIPINLTYDEMVTIGLCIKRAINIYDFWCINHMLPIEVESRKPYKEK